MTTPSLIPSIPEGELTPLVKHLLLVIQGLSEQLQQANIQIQTLKDEIAKLKNQKPKPDIKPSQLNQSSKDGKGVSAHKVGVTAIDAGKFNPKSEL